jgi:hypothetical protein
MHKHIKTGNLSYENGIKNKTKGPWSFTTYPIYRFLPGTAGSAGLVCWANMPAKADAGNRMEDISEKSVRYH